MGVYSCGDNDDFSSQHVLTDAEIAEMHRQDSIDSVNRSKLDVDFLLEYTTEITISSQSYDGSTVDVETDKLAEFLGLSEEDFLAGIDGQTGPTITGYAIEQGTHAIVNTKSNSNSSWGHWWSADGKVMDWGDGPSTFCEFNTETKQFTVGQYPGKLVAGQTYVMIECLKYEDKRVGVQITATAKERGSVSATVVSTQNLSVTQYPRVTFDSDAVEFDVNKVMSDLGVSSMNDVSVIGVKADGSYEQECTATNGFWYDKDGYPGSYGSDASIYVEYYGMGDEVDESDLNKLYVGQYPGDSDGGLSAGYSTNVQLGFMANSKVVMINIAFKVVAYDDPETAPSGTPADATANVTIEKTWDNTYSNVQSDVAEVLRNAFKMTTYQIHQALVNKELQVYVDEAGTEAPSYTSDSSNGNRGYWLDANGKSCAYADGQVFCCLGTTPTSLYFYAGNHPSNCLENTTVTTKYVVSCKGVNVTFNITIKVGAAAE